MIFTLACVFIDFISADTTTISITWAIVCFTRPASFRRPGQILLGQVSSVGQGKYVLY